MVKAGCTCVLGLGLKKYSELCLHSDPVVEADSFGRLARSWQRSSSDIYQCGCICSRSFLISFINAEHYQPYITQTLGSLHAVPSINVLLQLTYVAMKCCCKLDPLLRRRWWTVYTSHVPAHSTVWSNQVAVFCRITHYINVWKVVLKKASESQDIFFCYYRSCKNALTILVGEHAHFATGFSRVHYLKSGYVI